MKSVPNNDTTWRHLRHHVVKLVPSTVHASIALKQRKGLKFKKSEVIKVVISLFQTVKLPVLNY
jgi:hypothetical protein